MALAGKGAAMNTVLAFGVPFFLSAILIPFVKWISKKTDAWAKQNSRTIHHGIISRIGGIAIFLSFSIGMLLFFKPDRSILGIYLCTSIMFLIGLWDDFVDLPAKFKFLLQVLAALILLYYGVGVDTLRILGWKITNPIICAGFTVLWVVGITNAINLLDGLDGLCGGMILVVLSIVCAISIVDRRGDMVLLSLILMGSILGFLLYNSHPASIFMGDCGSLFLGSTIASLSLLGFKSSTMMTLSFPILILLLPIIDTFSAILRRKIKRIPMDQADRSHLHHQLMKRFGQTNSVIIMCGFTFGFGLSAFIYIYNRIVGLIVMFVLLFCIEVFIERTGMISSSFHPVHSIYRAFRKLLRKIFGRQNFEDLFDQSEDESKAGSKAQAETKKDSEASFQAKQPCAAADSSLKPGEMARFVSDSQTMSFTDTSLDLKIRDELMASMHEGRDSTLELSDVLFEKTRLDPDFNDANLDAGNITAASLFRPQKPEEKKRRSKAKAGTYTHTGVYETSAPEKSSDAIVRKNGPASKIASVDEITRIAIEQASHQEQKEAQSIMQALTGIEVNADNQTRSAKASDSNQAKGADASALGSYPLVDVSKTSIQTRMDLAVKIDEASKPSSALSNEAETRSKTDSESETKKQ